MLNRILFPAVLLIGLIFSSCGHRVDKGHILALQEKFNTEKNPEKKSQLAGSLHKAYSIYHLEHENDTTFLLAWANMARTGKEYETAKRVLGEYISMGYAGAKEYRERAEINLVLGYTGEAATDYKKAADSSTDPHKKSMWSNYARYYESISDSISEINASMVAADSHVNNLRMRRADFLIDARQYNAARYDIDKVRASDPEENYSNYLLGKIYSLTGENNLAEQNLEKFLHNSKPSDPGYPEASDLLDRVKKKTSLQEAEKELMDKPASYQSLMKAGTLAFELKDYPRARGYFDDLVKNYPDSIYGYLYRGQVYIQTRKLDLAENDLQSSLKIDPGNIPALNLLAYVYVLQNNRDRFNAVAEQIKQRGGELLEVNRQFKAR